MQKTKRKKKQYDQTRKKHVKRTIKDSLFKEYKSLVEQAESSLYSTKQIPLPTSQCIEFYNGETDMPEETILRLSDAFANKKTETDIELNKEKAERNEALNQAIDYCITHDILSDFLKKYRVEVLGMLLEEFDAKKYERTIRQEGREEILKIVHILIAQNRIEDLDRATQDAEYRRQLLEEFSLISQPMHY